MTRTNDKRPKVFNLTTLDGTEIKVVGLDNMLKVAKIYEGRKLIFKSIENKKRSLG